jgi:hypothetical protein
MMHFRFLHLVLIQQYPVYPSTGKKQLDMKKQMLGQKRNQTKKVVGFVTL